MVNRIAWLCRFAPILLFAYAPSSASAALPPAVRIGLFMAELPQEIRASAQHGFLITASENGQTLYRAKPGESVTFARSGDKIIAYSRSHPVGEFANLKLDPDRVESPLWLATKKVRSRPYTGSLTITVRSNYLLAVNTLPTPDYLYAVAAAEMPVTWPKEAMKAQWVVARTFCLRNLGRHQAEGYDFCDITHCQVYQGRSPEAFILKALIPRPPTDILTYQGRSAEAYFHSACGGHTASADETWGAHGALPYLGGVSDADDHGRPFCRMSPDFAWRARLTRAPLELIAAAALPGAPTRLLGMSVAQTTSMGRAKDLRLDYAEGPVALSAETFYLTWGRLRGWHQLKSTWFAIERQGDVYTFTGHGLGHGVGLCQWGAYGRAKAGQTYRQILLHYFPGVALEPDSE